MLAPFLGDLDRIAPCFNVHGSQIRILKTPSEFYETLKVRAEIPRLWATLFYWLTPNSTRYVMPSAGYSCQHYTSGSQKKSLYATVLYRDGFLRKRLTVAEIITLQEALRARPALKLYILTDALRGTRESPEPSCATLLAPLVEEFGADRVEVRMYHTPNLTGLRKKYIPRRINEGWGLQHMKLYGVDDEIILSG